jgi:hypothetical protein
LVYTKEQLEEFKNMSFHEKWVYWAQCFRARYSSHARTMKFFGEGFVTKEEYLEWIRLGPEFEEAFWRGVQCFDDLGAQEGDFVNAVKDIVNS